MDLFAPPKNPYFTLPDAKYLRGSSLDLSPVARSIKAIYGRVEAMSERKQADFLLRLISHSEFKPGFDSMSTTLGLHNQSAVRQRLKSLCDMHGFKLTGENVEATKSVPDFDQSTLLTMPEPPVVKAEPDATKPKAKRAYNKKKTAPTKVEEPDRETETKRPAPNTTSPPRKRAKTARNIPRKLPGKRQSKLLPEFDNIAGQYGQYLEDLSTRAVSAMLGKEQDKTPGSEVAEEAEASSQASTTGIVAPTTFAHVVHIHDDGGDED